MSFALIDKQTLEYKKGIGDFLIEEFVIPEGMLLSYKNTIHHVNRCEPVLRFKVIGAYGRAEIGQSGKYYSIYVLGINTNAVCEVIREIEDKVGAVELTPRYISLPTLNGFKNRCMFLYRWLRTGLV